MRLQDNTRARAHTHQYDPAGSLEAIYVKHLLCTRTLLIGKGLGVRLTCLTTNWMLLILFAAKIIQRFVMYTLIRQKYMIFIVADTHTHARTHACTYARTHTHTINLHHCLQSVSMKHNRLVPVILCSWTSF